MMAAELLNLRKRLLLMQNPIIQQYQQQAAEAGAQFDRYNRLVNQYSVLRLIDFALFFACIYYSVKQADLLLFAACFIILGLIFAWLVKRQSEFETRKVYYAALKAVNENETASITNHSNLYSNGAQYSNEKHLYTSDLDIFGTASLYQLVNRVATQAGNDKLSLWLSSPAAQNEIEDRQQAIKELGTKNLWKLDVQAKLFFAKDDRSGTLFFKYLHTPLNLSGEKWLNIYSKIAPWLMLVLVVLSFYFPVAIVAVLAGLTNAAIAGSKNQFIKKVNTAVEKMGAFLGGYAAVFKCIENNQWQSPLTRRLSANLITEQGISTSAKIRELNQLIDKFNYRYNMLVGFFLNAFLLWDIRQIIAIENWKRSYHQSIDQAFEVVSEFEALYSLAGLHINYPEWCFPQIAAGAAYTYEVKQMAHPLISETSRIPNDYQLTDTFKIDIITGSNMAGKSTFLRTLGINAVLALCGAPACALEMTVSVIQIATYMRIKDSLNESTSTFKAELDRLQMLLKTVEEHNNTFFLIDEMLRGTNSADKYTGSKAVIEQLINKRGVGLVATHDLQLAQLEQKYPHYIRNFYFDIQIQDGEMLFDYKIKPGECKTFNASILLQRIGINVGLS